MFLEATGIIKSFDGKVKELILIGVTREQIAACAKENGFEHYSFADSFEEALTRATASAKEGDAVLLSPASASFDSFPNFEVRGDTFKEIVNSL